jgi:hypothetical protein
VYEVLNRIIESLKYDGQIENIELQPFLINNYLSFFAVFEEGLSFLKNDTQDLIKNGQASLLICMIVSLIVILISILAVYPLIREF